MVCPSQASSPSSKLIYLPVHTASHPGCPTQQASWAQHAQPKLPRPLPNLPLTCLPISSQNSSGPSKALLGLCACPRPTKTSGSPVSPTFELYAKLTASCHQITTMCPRSHLLNLPACHPRPLPLARTAPSYLKSLWMASSLPTSKSLHKWHSNWDRTSLPFSMPSPTLFSFKSSSSPYTVWRFVSLPR